MNSDLGHRLTIPSKRRAFSLTEILVALSIVAILLGLLVPAVLAARTTSRRLYCGNNLRQIAIAVISYESSHSVMPPGRMIPDYIYQGEIQQKYTNYSKLNYGSMRASWTGFRSVHLLALPFLDQAEVDAQVDMQAAITQRMSKRDQNVNPNFDVYSAYQKQFICVADITPERTATANNYRYNFGGSTPYAGSVSVDEQTNRSGKFRDRSCRGNGAFTIGKSLNRSHFTDGLSNTVMFSERIRGAGGKRGKSIAIHSDIISMPKRTKGMISESVMLERCGSYQPGRSIFHFHASGTWLGNSDFSNGWPFGAYSCTMYNHVAPPNWEGFDCGSWSSIPDTPGEHAIVSARSKHPGGVNVVAADGHTKFISDEISPKIWTSIGTRNGSERVSRISD